MISHTKVACEELLVMIPGEASILRHPAKRVSPIENYVPKPSGRKIPQFAVGVHLNSQ
jgi:hypothetical protein